MKILKSFALFLILSGTCFTQISLAKSRVLVISDVDDTIKLSNVRSTIDKGFNAFMDFNAFLGMADLYQAIERQPETSIYYVSNAPSFLMHSRHTEFLNQFGFPQLWNLRTRPDSSDQSFKVQTILQLVDQEQPEVLVLIGDNGEHDPLTFQIVRETLAATRPVYVLSFVHKVYATVDRDDEPLDPLTNNELLFVTPIEVGMHLMRFGILPLSTFHHVAQRIIPEILVDGHLPVNSRSFPEWKDCSYYEWSIPTRGDEPKGTEDIKRLIENRCGVRNLTQ